MIDRVTSSTVRWKSVALPAEHGGWGFLLEPIALGLLVAPSFAGVLLGLAALGAFLMRQPLKVALIDRRRGKYYARTRLAERFALLYGGLAALCMLAAIGSVGFGVVLPLILAAPLGMIQLVYDARSDSRNWLPELAGAVALAAVASSIALAGGWTRAPIAVLWAIQAARDIPSVLYVRARLRLEHGKAVPSVPTLAAHGAALAASGGLYVAGFVPLLTVIAAGVLFVRAAYGLSKYHRPTMPKVIGLQELGYGTMMVVMTAVGYAIRV